MSDNTTPVDLNAKRDAFLKKCENVLVSREKMDRVYARKTLNELYQDRIVVGGRGPVRVLRPGTLDFYETGMDDDTMMAPVLSEMVQACPDEYRLEAVKERENNMAELVEEKRNDPSNWAL